MKTINVKYTFEVTRPILVPDNATEDEENCRTDMAGDDLAFALDGHVSWYSQRIDE